MKGVSARFGVFFPGLPWLSLSAITIPQTCKLNRSSNSFLKPEIFISGFYQFFLGLNSLQASEICIRRISEFRDFTFKKAMCEAGGSEDKITQSICQVTIYPNLKILPCEIGIFCFRKCTAKYKSEQIRFKIVQIFVQPDGPSPGGGELAPFQIQKFICRHIFRQDIVSMLVKHRWKHDAVKDNVVFPDKMYQTGLLILPVSFP